MSVGGDRTADVECPQCGETVCNIRYPHHLAECDGDSDAE